MSEEFLNHNSENSNSGINIKEEILNYLHYWKWFLFSLTIAILAVFIYLRYTPETYYSYAKIKILDESKGLELSTQGGGLFTDTKNLDNEILVIKSTRLLKKVVDSLDLHIRYFVEGQFTSKEQWNGPFKLLGVQPKDNVSSAEYYIEITNEGLIVSQGDEHVNEFIVDGYNLNSPKDNFPFLIQSQSWITKYIGATYKVVIVPLNSAANQLSGAISVSKVGSTDILQLSMLGENKKRSEVALNKILEQFNEDGVSDRQLVFQRTIDFVDDRFMYLAEELDSIEDNKKEFQQDNKFVSFADDAGYSLGKRNTTEEAILELQNQIALSKLLENPLNSGDLSTLMPESIGLESVNTNGIISQYNTVVLERENLISSAGVNNPKVVALNGQLLELRNSLKKSLQGYYEQLNLSLKRLEKEENTAIDLVRRMPEKEKKLRAIERQQNLKENLYLLLLQRREEAAINLAITLPSIKVVEYAFSSNRAVTPDARGMYTKGALVALLLPLGILFLVFKSDTKIYDKADISNLSRNIPIVGEVPELKTDDKLFENPNDRTILAESFRILSTNLKYILKPKADNSGHIIYVTSTIKGEGKTLVSVNLALAYSSINKKVLLIGADLRNPKIAVADGDNKNKGLSDFLFQSSANWKDYLQKSKYNVNFLDVLTAGTIPPNPTELLSNGKLKELLNEAKSSYDYIIIDTAPIMLVTDTLLISQYADATIYVARAGFTDKKLLGFSSELYTTQKLNNMVYVVNNISDSKTSKGYGYNYGYGYGYDNDEIALKKYSWSWIKNEIKEAIRKF
ncbi:polysaccharide biosynthesis tyrosine autokinase [Formosa sp. 4Alg 33]|uniref:polysaccharide biosynthesis tyrosine autokinase n=1 Tax=Formosa sp. 4Alg 33 TaxID=3382189 RepID=UPI003D9C153C